MITQKNDKAQTPHQYPDLPASGARPRPGTAPSSPRSGRLQCSRADPRGRRVWSPSPPQLHAALGQNLTGCLTRVRLYITGFPQWENGKRGENGPLCFSFCTVGGVGAGSLGRGQLLHLSPAPAPPSVSRWEQFSPLFQFQIGFKFPSAI